MLNWVQVTLAATAFLQNQNRTFNNPILNYGEYSYPNAFKINDTFYVLTEDTHAGHFEIHTSNDLVEWKSAVQIFKGKDAPEWADIPYIATPRINQFGSNFVIHFMARGKSGGLQYLNFAISKHLLGPYTSIEGPHSDLLGYPTVMYEGNQPYLLYTSNLGIWTRPLNYDGLSFSSSQTISLLNSSLSWEVNAVSAPWYMKRRNYHYLFYTGVWECDGSLTGVARSRFALGPYEKFPVPILLPNSDFVCPTSVSVVKDLDGKSDLIFFAAYRNDTSKKRSVLLATLNWGEDEWPYVGDF